LTSRGAIRRYSTSSGDSTTSPRALAWYAMMTWFIRVNS